MARGLVEKAYIAVGEFVVGVPEEGEYASFYGTYVDQVRTGNLLERLRHQGQRVDDAVSATTEEESLRSYAPGKWTVRQVLGHMADSERVFSYRLLRIGRSDPTPLAGFEQNPYVAAADFNARRLSDLAEDFRIVRRATLRLLDTLSADDLTRTGIVNGDPISARALVFVIAGHAEHHLRILRDQYGVGRP
ncbi:MAG: DUF664 domain-containing protein [Gemmatimonas sp.]|nr:DUF664 domain-containing protein [Gemmatimonas sp.]